jgi:hypothetical protein
MKIISGARRATIALMIGCLMLPQALWAQMDGSGYSRGNAIDESPNEFAMVGDLLVARPIGAVMTVGGVAVWLVSLPFTLMAGHASEAAETLMLGPAQATFWRCLGCRNTGYTGRDIEQTERNEEKVAEREESALDAEHPRAESDFP